MPQEMGKMASEKTPRRLGRGLDALFGTTADTPPTQTESGLREIPIRNIRRNPFQPRKDFDPEQLKELQESLATSGLLQPITVRHSQEGGESYDLIAGERRLRAANQLGWNTIPAVIKDLDDKQLLALALIENLQRTDLNPIEEAEGYDRLIKDFSHTQQTVASMVGKDRSTVANMLRILQLPGAVRQMVREGTLTVGHVRPLLALNEESRIVELAREIAAKGLSARDIEQRVRESAASAIKSDSKRKRGRPTRADSRPADLRNLEERLRRYLQTDVSVTPTSPGKGFVKISFYSPDDLERIADLMGLTENPQ